MVKKYAERMRKIKTVSDDGTSDIIKLEEKLYHG